MLQAVIELLVPLLWRSREGLKLGDSCIDLYIGVTFAVFHSDGIVLVEIVRLMMLVIGSDTSRAASFNNRAEIPSRPVAFVDFIWSSSFRAKPENTSSRTKS